MLSEVEASTPSHPLSLTLSPPLTLSPSLSLTLSPSLSPPPYSDLNDRTGFASAALTD